MADYYIHAVHQVDDIIAKVKTCTSYTTSGPGASTEKSRTTVVNDIDSGKTIFTIYRDSNYNWKLGEIVRTVLIGEKKYIKTKINNKKCDNLDNIDQY